MTVPNDLLYPNPNPALARAACIRFASSATPRPNVLAQAVCSGPLAARELDEPPAEGSPFRVERASVRTSGEVRGWR
jgi:hypothetical protein